MPSEIEIYADYMTGVRMRVAVIKSTMAMTGMPEFAKAELVFLQFRKALELVAFATLAANKEAYAKASPKFAEEWRAKQILEKIEKINPEFWPMALNEPEEVAPDRKHFSRPNSGFLTKAEFATLYDVASEIIHTRNPFTGKAPTINTKYSVEEWIARLQRLLSWHRVGLVSGTMWVVRIPDQGDVEVWPAAPLNA
jgi:hypothetical protein